MSTKTLRITDAQKRQKRAEVRFEYLPEETRAGRPVGEE